MDIAIIQSSTSARGLGSSSHIIDQNAADDVMAGGTMYHAREMIESERRDVYGEDQYQARILSDKGSTSTDLDVLDRGFIIGTPGQVDISSPK